MGEVVTTGRRHGPRPHVAHSPVTVCKELSLNFKLQTRAMKMFVGSAVLSIGSCPSHFVLNFPGQS